MTSHPKAGALAMLPLAALAAFAPHAAATNGDQMLGLSAIQNGMAGAVVAAPRDATTVLVNPAGMAELGIKDMRFDLGVGFLNPPRRVNGMDSDSNLYMMPAGAVNFRVNERLSFGPVFGRLLVSPAYHRLHHAIGYGHESAGAGSLGGHNFR